MTVVEDESIPVDLERLMTPPVPETEEDMIPEPDPEVTAEETASNVVISYVYFNFYALPDENGTHCALLSVNFSQII